MRIPIIIGTAFLLGLFLGRTTNKSTQTPRPGISSKKPGKHRPNRTKAVQKTVSLAQISTPDLDELIFSINPSSFELLAQQARDSSSPVMNNAMLRVLISEWAKNDPEAALKFSADLNRSDLLEIALFETAKARGQDALSLLDRYASKMGDRSYLASAVYRGLATVDPEGAVEMVEQLPQGNEREDALYAVMGEWIRQDVNAVFSWMETSGELSPQLHNIYSTAMSRYILEDPEQAALVIADMEACQLKTELATQSVRHMAETDIDAALNWSLSLDENARKQALLTAMDVWASGPNSEEALQYIMDNGEAEGYEALFRSTIVSISYNQPELLLEQLPNMVEADRIITAERLAIAYSTIDPDKCIEMLNSLPEGNVRDAALQPTMQSYRYTQPDLAFDLSQQFSSSYKRLEEMENTLLEWAKTDYNSALNALNESTALSAEHMETLKQRFLHNSQSNDYVLP